MSTVSRAFSRCVAILLVFALVMPSLASAKSKPLTIEAIHARLLQRGLRNWAGVELRDGVVLWGRIVSIDKQSFGLQLHNDPAITTITYSDIVKLDAGLTRKQGWTIGGICGGVVIGLIAGMIPLMKDHPNPLKPPQAAEPIIP